MDGSTAKETVLEVEDEVLIAWALRDVLERNGYAVVGRSRRKARPLISWSASTRRWRWSMSG